MNKFQSDRNIKKKENFVRVAAIAALMIIFGLGGCVIDFGLQLFGQELLDVDNVAAITCFLILFSFYTSGMILLSTCLNDDFDADDIMESSSSKYKYLRYMFAVVFFLVSLPAAGFPPYFGLLISFSAILMSFRSFEYYSFDKFTYKLSAYMIGWVVIFAWAFLWGGIKYINKRNFEITEIIQPIIPLPDHPKGRAMVPAFLLISLILSCLLFFSLTYLWRKIGEGMRPTKVTLYCLYVFLAGIATCLIILGIAIMIFDSNTPEVYNYYDHYYIYYYY